MGKPLKVMFAAGFITLLSSAATGLASAAPDANGLANTKCSYGQIVKAVNAEVPGEASGINNRLSCKACFATCWPPGRRNG